MCLYLCEFMYTCMFRCLQRSEQGIRSFGARVPGICELPEVLKIPSELSDGSHGLEPEASE